MIAKIVITDEIKKMRENRLHCERVTNRPRDLKERLIELMTEKFCT